METPISSCDSGAAPASRNGWFPVPRAELAVIGEQFAGEKAASATCVYVALLSLCNEQRSAGVEVRLSQVAKVANVSYPTAIRRVHDLEKLGLVTVSRRSQYDGKTPDAPSTYTVPFLHSAAPPVTETAQAIPRPVPSVPQPVPPITVIPRPVALPPSVAGTSPTINEAAPSVNVSRAVDRHALRNEQDNTKTNTSMTLFPSITEIDQPATGTVPANPGRHRKNEASVSLEALVPESLRGPEFMEMWGAFIEHRKALKAPFTQKAAEIMLRKLTGWGAVAALEALDNAICSGWKGVYAPHEHRGLRSPPASLDVFGTGGDHADGT